ncbi:MarR family transcriptional regulator, partial [Bartonella sp. CL29QHWL]|uniref:MarR family transcriptional regulator n=1 Tax=Bartonella sp. CL29QHWL TaxID=3243522 RepID=UPI0035D04469
CCFIGDEAEALRQTLEFNSEFREPLPDREVIQATKSAEKAWKARSDEKANEIAKSLGYPGAGYNISNAKLIEWLDITEDEQRQLGTIIDASEKRRRKAEANRKARRAAGMASRDEYISEQAKRTGNRLEALRKALEANPDATQRELAELLGIEQAYVCRLLKKS